MKNIIKVNGFKQNCFRLANVSETVVSDTDKSRNQLKYLSLEKQMLPNGYVQSLVEKDYPINSESVTSLADGADYKNDPLQAIANSPVRVNLGDITQAQEFMKNPQNCARIYEHTKQKLAEYYALQRELSKKTEPIKDENKEDSNV